MSFDFHNMFEVLTESSDSTETIMLNKLCINKYYYNEESISATINVYQ